jgi:NADPH:quinone reductase-like Zn-dependent oxidoreductase
MKTLEFHRYGSPEVLQLKEVPRPEPGEGEVLIEIRATAVNPSDVKNVAGSFKSPLPRVPGRDFAGVIVAGEAEVGTEVWGSGPGFGVVRDGAHREYIVMPAEWASKKPVSLSMEQAAAIGVPYVTAWSALVQAGALEPGETILVVGVTGAVGRAAAQIARWKGARVIGACRNLSSAPEADALVDTASERFSDEVRALTGGRGADLVLDTVGAHMFEPSLRCLRPEGRQVAITSSIERRVCFDLIDFYRNRSRLLGVNTMALTGVATAEMLNELRRGFEEGHLRPPEVVTWPLERAVEAYETVGRGGCRAKQVLVP